MKTKAWLSAVKRAANCSTAYQLVEAWETDNRTSITAPRFDRFSSGRLSPAQSSRKAVEQLYPGTISVFERGPGDRLSLWDVLSGPVEYCWTACVMVRPELERMRRLGAPQSAKVADLTEQVLGFPIKADFLEWSRGRAPNSVADTLKRLAADAVRADPVGGLCRAPITIDGVTALVAMHRLSLFFGAGSLATAYVLDGLEESVIPTLFEPFAISNDLIFWLRRMDEIDLTQFAHLLPVSSLPAVDPMGGLRGF